MNPDVTVIIPTWNRASLVRDAIDSALSQTSEDLSVEVIVVDDASTDDTPAVLAAYGESIRCFRQQSNLGQCVARNLGLDNARGRYLKFLDSDDVLCAGSLREEVALADATSADMVVSGWIETTLDADGREIESSQRSFEAPVMEPMPEAVLWGRAVPTGGGLYRAKGCWDLRWDTSFSKLDDWDWFCMAALRSGRIVARLSPAYEMRAHAGYRITSSETMLSNARAHHHILGKIEAWLAARDELTDARKRRLAQYYYKEMRVLCLHDRPAFEAGVRKILELDPTFVPRDEERQWWMRWLARVVGFRFAILLHSAVKSVARGRSLQ